MRPSWPAYWLAQAKAAATRSTCPRAAVGCVLVSLDNHPLAMGFNGSMRGAPHCTDAGCLMPHGGCVRTVHAEQNAVAMAAKKGIRLEGATAYVTHSPCMPCMMILVNAGIVGIQFGELYRINDHLDSARALGISVEQI